MAIQRLRLVQLNEREVGSLHYVIRPITSIGRAPTNDVVINHKQVSRQHVIIRILNGGEMVTAEDCRSADGAFVNGERIFEPTELEAGMTLTVGDIDFRVETATEAQEQEARESTQLESPGTIDVDDYVDEAAISAHRNAELDALGLRNLDQDDAWDEIANIAATIFSSSLGFVSVVGEHECFYRGAFGLAQRNWKRGESPCALVVEAHAPIWVGEMFVDPKLLSLPFLSQEPKFRFYAAAPYCGPSGIVIGTAGVATPDERSASETQMAALSQVARCVERPISLQLEKRRAHEFHARLVENESKRQQSPDDTK